MIYAAADVSGNPDEGNHKFMGIVLITEDHFRSIINYTGLKQIPIGALNNQKLEIHFLPNLSLIEKKVLYFV